MISKYEPCMLLGNTWNFPCTDILICLSGIDITEENLEDLLAYDDLFLDYFNAFLSLPVRNCCAIL